MTNSASVSTPLYLRLVQFLRSQSLRFLPVIIISVLVFFLHQQFEGFHLQQVLAGAAEYSLWILLLAACFVAISYALGGVYDNIAANYFELPIAARQVFLAGTLATTFSNNVGFSALSGAAVRFRFYSQWNIGVGSIAKVTVFHALTYWLGILLVIGLWGVIYSQQISSYLPFSLSGGVIQFIAVSLLLVYCALLYLGIAGKTLRVRGFSLEVPPPKITLLQTILSVIDCVLTAGIFYLLLPASPHIDFSLLLIIFLIAQLVGFASSIPAGLGAFDGTILLLLGPVYASHEMVLTTLLMYRLLAYLIPFIIAALLFGIYELYQHRQHIVSATAVARKLDQALVPRIAAAVIFMAGLLLIFSGVLPSAENQFHVDDNLPHATVEISHLLASLSGVGLLIVARGLLYRSRTSFYLTLGLLLAGLVFSLSKGWHIGTAAVLTAVFIALVPTREFFYRKQASLKGLLSLYWLGSLLFILGFIIWFVQWGHQGVDYSASSWWRFELLDDVPRTIRAMFAMALLLSMLFMYRLIYSTAAPQLDRSDSVLADADLIVQDSEGCEGYLALLGDKNILFNHDKSGFIMYGIQGRSWISMGDPIGDQAVRPELVWQFCEMADKHGAWPIFYEVSAENLAVYLDLGFTVNKIGEYARVFLPEFNLKGKSRGGLRQSVNRLTREGGSFEIIPADSVAAILPELRDISDQWLADKNSHEKGFSLGFFDEEYLLRHQPMAVVRIDGKIVAFSNVWITQHKHEFTIDLMRFSKDAPNGVMDYLFIQLQLWGKEQGYQWFCLGMVPFSGLDLGLATTRWNTLVNIVYRHGEHFYNFEGLRHYKNKFSPQWESRYLVSPGGMRTALALKDISALISGSTMGIIKK